MSQHNFVLYSYFRSSASYRVRIAMGIKGLPYTYKAVHLIDGGGEQHKDDYRKLNPSREVPTLIHGDNVIAQSVAIIDYLDQVVPAPRLFPQEHLQRAKVLQACEIINSGAQPLVNLRVLKKLGEKFGANENQKEEWARDWITYGLETMESFLNPHSGRFSFGDTLTAADCFVMPHLFGADRFKVSLDPYSTLRRIRTNCETLEAFKKAAPSAQPDFPG